ncbi:MAG: NUDIX domain-containing protein [Hyphomonadaceae bacterium]
MTWLGFGRALALLAAGLGIVAAGVQVLERLLFPSGASEAQYALLVIVLALLVLIGYWIVIRRGRGDEAVRAYAGEARTMTISVPMSRIVALTAKAPAVRVADRASAAERDEALAVHVGLDPTLLAVRTQEWRAKLERNDRHIIAARQWDWAAPSAWIDPSFPTEQIDALATDFAALKAATSLSKSPEAPWRNLPRISSGALLVCRERQSVVVHLRAHGHDFADHYHVLGGNFEPDRDKTLMDAACREVKEESGLRVEIGGAPCLLILEDRTNWLAGIFLGVSVDAGQFDKMVEGMGSGAWRDYAEKEGAPAAIAFDDLAQCLIEKPFVPTGWQAVVAWLMAGAPCDGRPFLAKPKVRRVLDAVCAAQPRFTPPTILSAAPPPS